MVTLLIPLTEMQIRYIYLPVRLLSGANYHRRNRNNQDVFERPSRYS